MLPQAKRVVNGWSDENVRHFAKNWVARAEARKRLADEAIAALRAANPTPVSPLGQQEPDGIGW